MDQDFVFINPQNIPPRRAVPHKKKSNRKRIQPRYVPELESQENYFPQPGPNFNFANEFAGQIILSGNNSTPSNEEYFLPENDADLLTQAIFGSEPKRVREVRQAQSSPGVPEASLNVAPTIPLKTEAQERAELVAELEKIDEADTRFFRRIGRLVAPGRVSPIRIKSPEYKTSLSEIQQAIKPAEPDFDLGYAEPEPIEPKVQDLARAEADWFQVGLMDQEVNRVLPKLRQDRIKPDKPSFKDSSDPDKDSHHLKTFLAGLAIFLVPVTLGFLAFSGGPNFVKTAVASFNDKFLGATSFTLVNSGESSMFAEVGQARNSLASAGNNTDIVTNLDNFLEKNNAFSWLNIFKKKVLGSNIVTVAGADELAKAIQAIPDSIENKLAKEKLKDSANLFSFWDQLFTPEKKYLVVMLDANTPRSIGGKPLSYAVVKVNADGLEVMASGKFSDLDAAADAKIVPPQAIQVTSTAWLPSETGWFLNFSDSAGTLLDFFERTTQTKTDGLVTVSQDFLKAVSFRESLIFDINSPSWLYGLNEALAHKPDGRWNSLADFLNSGLANHQVQFYFKDGALEQKVADENWSAETSHTVGKDFLGITWSSLKSSGSNLDLVEHKATVFEDGSLVVNLSLTARQDNGESNNYFKIYLPKGIQVLNGDGFSNKPALPKFDYSANGFSIDSRLSPVVTVAAASLKNADTFEESGLTVVGGWLELKSGERKKINLQYVLPFRLAYKNSRASYNFKVLRPGQTGDVPFRFSLTSDKSSTSIISLDPNGFISQNSGEYQANLSQDLSLTASLVSNGE